MWLLLWVALGVVALLVVLVLRGRRRRCVLIVRYPPGDFRDRNGAVDNAAANKFCRELADAVRAGGDVYFPNRRDGWGEYEWQVEVLRT